MEDLLQEIFGTTLSAEQIEANIRRQRNIEYEQDLIKNSKQEGIKLGKEEGQEETQKEIINKLLSKGKTFEEISELLDLTVDEVKKYL